MGLSIGPGGVVYVVVLALMTGVSVYTQANLIFWALGLMFGGLLVSVFMAFLALRSVTVTRVLPAHGVVGEAMALRYEVRNTGRFLPVFNLIVREHWTRRGSPTQFTSKSASKSASKSSKGAGTGSGSASGSAPTSASTHHPDSLAGLPHGWVLHLGAGQVVMTEAPCWPTRRGMLSFESVELSTSFPFGVVRRTLRVPAPGRVLVYPKLRRVNRRLMHRMSEVQAGASRRIERAGGSEEFFSLRQYRSGDSMRMIDWKRTARTGQLISREMTQPSPMKLMLGLDLRPLELRESSKATGTEQSDTPGTTPGSNPGTTPGSSPAPDEPTLDIAEGFDEQVERAISLAASVICDAHLRRCQVGLVVTGVPCQVFPLHHSLPHRTRMLEALSLLDTSIRTFGSSGASVKPSVVICPRGVESATAKGVAITLVAEQMDSYMEDFVGGAQAALADPSLNTSPKREQVARGGDA
jgi:uncharacterized protein (DUF58 family)